MNRYLAAVLILLAVTIIAGLFGFGVIRSSFLDWARIVFFAVGTLFVAALMLWSVQE